MPTALLSVSVQDDVLCYSLCDDHRPSPSSAAYLQGSSKASVDAWLGEAVYFWRSLDVGRLDSSVEHASRFVDEVFSGAAAALKAKLRRFALAAPNPTLAVLLEADAGAIEELEWELLPLGLGLRGLLVVQVKSAKPSPPRAEAGSSRALSPDDDDGEMRWRGGGTWRDGGAAQTRDSSLLVIGSARDGGASLAGIERELTELPKRFKADVLVEPDEMALANALITKRPSSLHITLPRLFVDPNGKQVFAFSGAPGVEPQMGVASLASSLAQLDNPPSLIVLNARSCQSAARLLSRETGATVIGFRGAVDDQEAADFALFFHARIAEGASPESAVRAYLARPGERTAASFPVIYVDAPPLEGEPDTAPPTRGYESKMSGLLSAGDRDRGMVIALGPPVTIDVALQPVLNPALLKNGVPAIARLSIDAREPVKDALLVIACDAGFNVSVYREQRPLLRGAQPIDVKGAHFPNLYELSDKDAGRRRINFTISVQGKGQTLAEVTRSAVWMDRREWLDQKDTWAYIPAFVAPRSEKVQEIMKSAGARLSGTKMWGYQGRSAGDVREQMKAVLRALQELKIDYTNPLGSPVYLEDVQRSSGQVVRSPDQIARDGRGTCHDLALLFASCAENVRIRPLVVLMHGHTFFGFWTSAEAHSLFWRQRPSSTFGDGWLIRRLDDLKDLLEHKSVELLEATHAADGNKDYAEACSRGAEHVTNLTDQTFEVAVDVWASRRYIQPV